MKPILWTCAGLLLALAAALGAFRLFYDYEYHKIRPLCGEWHSTLDGTRLVIAPCSDEFRITLTRCGAGTGRSTSETHVLHYRDCIHYTTYGGRRVDLFYTPAADALLLVPGGTFERTSKSQHHE